MFTCKTWLLLAVGLWAFLVPSWALVPGNPACGPKIRVWDFFAKTGISCLANQLVSASLASGKVACVYGNRVDPNCCGEQWDADLGLYYNRARYLNTDMGRFWNADSYEGNRADPQSLHKYLYANANPVLFSDPSGNFPLGELSIVQWTQNILRAIAVPTIQRISQTVAFNIIRLALAQDQILFYTELAGVALGGLAFAGDAANFFADAADSWLKNTESIPDEARVRGVALEGRTPRNLGGNVNTIDHLDSDGTGVSIRTHGLDSEQKLLTAIRSDAREVSSAITKKISGRTYTGERFSAPAGTVQRAALLVGVPENQASLILRQSVRMAIEEYRETYGVFIRVVPVRGWRK